MTTLQGPRGPSWHPPRRTFGLGVAEVLTAGRGFSGSGVAQLKAKGHSVYANVGEPVLET